MILEQGGTSLKPCAYNRRFIRIEIPCTTSKRLFKDKNENLVNIYSPPCGYEVDACSPQNISGASQQSERFATAAPIHPLDAYYHFYLSSYSEEFGLKRVLFFRSVWDLGAEMHLAVFLWQQVETAATPFCCEAQEMFCGLLNSSRLHLSWTGMHRRGGSKLWEVSAESVSDWAKGGGNSIPCMCMLSTTQNTWCPMCNNIQSLSFLKLWSSELLLKSSEVIKPSVNLMLLSNKVTYLMLP